MGNPEKPNNNPEEASALPAPLSRDQLWAQAALAGELEKLANLPEGENVNKADSPFFASLVKIAAVIKGSGREHVSASEALVAILDACSSYNWLKEKEIERQWRNAYNFADPRFRND